MINKLEQVNPSYIPQIKQALESINPLAKVLLAEGNGATTEAMGFQRRTNDRVQTMSFSLAKTFSSSHANAASGPIALGNSHQRHLHSNIETILLKYTEDFDLQPLEHRLREFLFLQSSGVYRIKCIIHSPDYERKVIVQSAAQRLSVTLGQNWSKEEKRESKIVIIGKSLQLGNFSNSGSSPVLVVNPALMQVFF